MGSILAEAVVKWALNWHKSGPDTNYFSVSYSKAAVTAPA
jgi:hypothetical protein